MSGPAIGGALRGVDIWRYLLRRSRERPSVVLSRALDLGSAGIAGSEVGETSR